jgi:glycosyltransferase involved in cell wall biosynthesis
MLKVLAFTNKPVLSPDTRYRFLQYLNYLKDADIEVRHLSLLDRRFYQLSLSDGRAFLKGVLYVWACLKRLVQLLVLVRQFDAVWILRELAPIGPPLFERLVFRLHSNVILDIDDAVFKPDDVGGGFVHHHLRDFSKFEKIACRYKIVVCGNRYLAAYFEKFGARVQIIPTVVCVEAYADVRRTPSPKPRLGWVGTPRNRSHFSIIEGPISRLAQKLDFHMIVVGLTRELNWQSADISYMPWEISGEIDFFGLFDIGLMPLLDSEFAKGKCAFKIIQYMAAGLPVVASPVGANVDVVRHGVNGFLADTQDEWEWCLHQLLTNPQLREDMGRRGRQTVRDRYSLEIWWKQYARIFKKEIGHA